LLFCVWLIIAISVLCGGFQLLDPKLDLEPISRPNDRFYMAINFFNNEEILPHFMSEFFKLVNFLGKDNVFVSIYENGILQYNRFEHEIGSKDKTKELLVEFKARLQAHIIPHRVLIDPREARRGEHRIPYMARIRNEVMRPLYQFRDNSSILGKHFSSASNIWVVFINDIYYKVKVSIPHNDSVRRYRQADPN
jgi:hypothetical protein